MKFAYCFERAGFNPFRTIAFTILVLIMAGLSLPLFCEDRVAKEPINYRTFDVKTDVDFRNYKDVIRQFVTKQQPETSNDFCIVGYLTDDNSKQAWILWHQGKQIILWESQETNLDFSRRRINLETDVVETDDDLQGSTYLVTRAWVNSLTNTCNRVGTKLQIRKPKS